MSKFSLEKAALILAEAEFSSDKSVAERWGISVRTLYRYRTEMAECPKMSENVREKVKEISDRHIVDCTKFLSKNLNTLTELIGKSVDSITLERVSTNPDQLIIAIAKAIETVGGIHLGYLTLRDPDSDSPQPIPEASIQQSAFEIRTAIIEPAKRLPPNIKRTALHSESE